MRILGVDPGSRLTGYGCVDLIGRQVRHVTHGVLHVSNTSGKAVVPLEDRLLLIFQGLSEVILQIKPDIMVVERVFFAKNAVSALKLGQARGVALLAGKVHSLQIAEYSPTQVKQMVVGHGHADKEQVAKMVQLIVGKQEFKTFDASDGLALAICHAQSGNVGSSLNPGHPLQSLGSQRKKKKMTLAECLGIDSSQLPARKKS